MSDQVLAEIARLSGAIASHKSATAQSSRSYSSGTRGRGGGRGRGRTITPRPTTTWIAPHLAQDQPSSTSTSSSTVGTSLAQLKPVGGYRNQVLVLEGPGAGATGTGSGDGSATRSAGPSTPKPASQQPTAPAPSLPVEIIIDGTTFVADPRGNKLVRKTGSSSALPSTSTSAGGPSTPLKTSVRGTTYIRTKTGNLVSLEFARRKKEQNEQRNKRERKDRLDRMVGVGVASADEEVGGDGHATTGRRRGSGRGRGASRGRGGRGRGRGRGGSSATATATNEPKKSTQLCRFFQKTGQCTRAHLCPYIHSSSHVSLCPLFLRSRCPLPPSRCLLSHTPNAHRSPHCAHFPHCTRPNCPYAHVMTERDAPICRAFVELGWCEKGAECGMRHSVECPEFAEKGSCTRKGCRLPHVLRRRNGQDEEEDAEEEEGDVDGEEGNIDHNASRTAINRTAKGKGKEKRRRSEVFDADSDTDTATADEREGISGAAGLKLSKKKKKRAAEDLEGNEDFVTLSIPLFDDEDEDDGDEDDEHNADEDEDEEGSVDSADLSSVSGSAASEDENPHQHRDQERSRSRSTMLEHDSEDFLLEHDYDFLVGYSQGAGGPLGPGSPLSDAEESGRRGAGAAPSSEYYDAEAEAPVDRIDEDEEGSDEDVERMLRY